MTRVFFTILSLTLLIVGALFATSDYSYAEKELGRCKLNGSPRELSDPELNEIFKCDQLLLIVENKLKIEDQVFLWPAHQIYLLHFRRYSGESIY